MSEDVVGGFNHRIQDLIKSNFGIKNYDVIIPTSRYEGFEAATDAITKSLDTLNVQICIKYDQPIKYVSIPVIVKK